MSVTATWLINTDMHTHSKIHTETHILPYMHKHSPVRAHTAYTYTHKHTNTSARTHERTHVHTPRPPAPPNLSSGDTAHSGEIDTQAWGAPLHPRMSAKVLAPSHLHLITESFSGNKHQSWRNQGDTMCNCHLSPKNPIKGTKALWRFPTR